MKKIFIKYRSLILIACLNLGLFACSDSGSSITNPAPSVGNNGSKANDWLIPEDQVLDAAGQDGILSIDNPILVSANDPQGKLNWIKEDDLILAIKIGDEIRGYPHPVLDWHEIVNDDFALASVAITYCPLTGTGIGWNREIDDQKTTFGVSGLLYNSNLMPYDRATESNWSQMRFDCVNGPRIGKEAQLFQLVEIPWKLWREWFPDAKIVVGDRHILSRPYDQYPYGDYRSQDNVLFPVERAGDARLPAKERVLGIVKNNTALVFPFSAFRFQEVNVRSTTFFGEEIIAIGSEKRNFIVAYYPKLEDGTPLHDFQPIQDKNEIIAIDKEGNEWNIFGEAVSGPKKGRRLQTAKALMGFWFTWPAFYASTQIYGI